VNPICSDRSRERGVAVDDERGAECGGQRPQWLRQFIPFARGQVLFPQLHSAHAAPQSLFHARQEVPVLALAAVADQVEVEINLQ
jgi:hypothetical protein